MLWQSSSGAVTNVRDLFRIALEEADSATSEDDTFFKATEPEKARLTAKRAQRSALIEGLFAKPASAATEAVEGEGDGSETGEAVRLDGEMRVQLALSLYVLRHSSSRLRL